MAVIPSGLSRVSDALRFQLVNEALTGRQVDLARLEQQIATGIRVRVGSDDPEGSRLVLALNDALRRSEQFLTNISRAADRLAAVDTALASVVDTLLEAQAVGQQESAVPSTAASRQAAADSINALIDNLIRALNRTQGGGSLFAGHADDAAPFELLGGAIRYRGDDGVTTLPTGEGPPQVVSVSGVEAVGAWNGRITGRTDLDALVTEDTLLAALNGGLGAVMGRITVSDGTTETTIDLSLAETVGDVIRLMEAALPATTSVAVNAAADGLTVSSTLPGANLTIRDVPGGATARHLGILTPAGGIGGDTVVGTDLDPQLGLLVRLDQTAAGATLDLASGFILTNGDYSAVVDLSACETVQDVINAINGSGTYSFARITADGRGLEVVSQLSGTRITIGENGGTTATDLGLRSMSGETLLADLNRGRGVLLNESGSDLLVTLSDGTSVEVDLGGAETVQDVLDALNAAAPGSLLARLAAVGNGLELVDLTGGGGTFSVANVVGSGAAGGLGLLKSVNAPADTITGDDVNPRVAENVLTDLIELRDALLRDDPDAVASITARLAEHTDGLVTVRARVGARLTALEAERTWLEGQRLADQELLSRTRDLDYTQAIAQFSHLSLLMEAALRTAAVVGRLSLLDYL